ncbi:MAG: DUF975 family protein [Lachnospiraceae bacterium]|nr:DUF975 family protein [Lachnospiraceae bacterium]
MAKIQTSQRFGILFGAIILKFIITSLTADLVTSLVSTKSAMGYVTNYILLFVVNAAASLLSVGASFIFLKTACNMKSTLEDLFCGFRKNTLKILEIGAVIALIESICIIPFDIASVQYTNVVDAIPFLSENTISGFSPFLYGNLANNEEFLEAYSVLYSATMKLCVIMVVCTVISLVLTLPFFPAFFMILDFPDWNVSTVLKRSFEVMHGNKLRLFLLYLSFVPSFLLSAFACGIPLIWILPYMNMATTNFYLDLMAVRNKSINSI